MKKIIFLLLLISFNTSFAQKVNREIYGNGRIKYEYQVNANGVKNGYYKYFASNGYLVETGFYKQGEKSGLWTTYDEYGKGQIYTTANYINGKLNGENKVWCWEQVNESVVRYLCAEYIYKNDEEVSSIKHNANNTISSKSVPNGRCFNNYSNGKIKEEWMRNDGETVAGTYKSYLENGKPEVETINGRTYTYNTERDCYGKIKEVTWDSSHYTFTKKYECSGNVLISVYDTITETVKKITAKKDDSTIQICNKAQYQETNCLQIYHCFSVQNGKQTVEEHLLNSKNEFVNFESISRDERYSLLDAKNRNWCVITKNDRNIIIEKYTYNEVEFFNTRKTISWEKFDDSGVKISQ